MSQIIRATWWSPFGMSWNVDGSGIATMSDSSIALNPEIEEPSKPMPSSRAPSSSYGVIAKLFRWPSMSVNQRRMNWTFSFSTRSSTLRRTAGSLVARPFRSIVAIRPPLKAKNPGTRCAPEAASPSCSFQCIGRPAPRLESLSVGDEASEVFPAPGLSSLERRRGGAILQQEVERQYLANGTQPEAADALEWAVETQAKMVDLKFCDLLGSWQHMTMPLRALDEGAFTDGLGFDGSSIRGWQGIAESDMLLVPDPASAVLDPFTAEP